ncbi:MAG: energy-coupling factor transporter transmembrane component T [Spirochaetes bacterium]|jgi:biotin transport system permease protein|nr:energy-coupling factor transporter transmembrane component T [Spirochaetota bacterium]
MVEVNLFHYSPGNSLLHRHNSVLFFAELLLLSFTLFFLQSEAILIYLLLIVPALIITKIAVTRLLQQLRGFIVLALIIGIAAGINYEVPQLEKKIFRGAYEMLRYLLFLLTGIVFVHTRSPRRLYTMIAWVSKIIPFCPVKKVASFFMIVFSLIPLIFETYNEVKMSIIARCGYQRGRVVHNIIYTAYPVLVNSVIRASDFADALISRSFNGERVPDMKESMQALDIIILMVILLSVVMMILSEKLIFS